MKMDRPKKSWIKIDTKSKVKMAPNKMLYPANQFQNKPIGLLESVGGGGGKRIPRRRTIQHLS